MFFCIDDTAATYSWALLCLEQGLTVLFTNVIFILFTTDENLVVFCATISGVEMSIYVRCYAKYLREKLSTYHLMGYDFCKVKRG